MYIEKHARLLDQINREEIVALTRELIRFKSVNPPGNELEIALFVGRMLEKEGFKVDILKHSSSRGSLTARWGNGGGQGLIFSGHLDVVPPEGIWDRDPFSGDVADGKIWGRGATDMKSGVAAMIAAGRAVSRAGLSLNGPLYLSFTAGEETDNLGAAETVKQYAFGPVKAVFIPEPSLNEVYTAEKGALWLEIKTCGRAVHTSKMEEGRNALKMMLPILEALDKLEISFEEHPLLGDYRRSPNAISAGKNANTIPAQCIVKVDQRTLPGQDHETIIQQVEHAVNKVAENSGLPDFKAEVRVLLDNPPLEVDFCAPFLQPLLDITGEINGKKQKEPKGVGFFTDAVKFTPGLGIPFAICGPGDPRLNHQANEWVDIDKIVDSARIYAIAAAEYL